ncbi:MAG: ThuA domain-containing protein [Actinobacteria bacterium HGW-Actinobacteria-11]|uniref:ThuA domain-containing protein n=1 Tax=unclassified Microbacterium TaxID=2609290 RepID=UPI000CA9EC20|nr:ThuA domain-containing protein [Microbacterium sp. 3H14]PKQ36567.1 MAG: ThuA domain-containing protein [Actinobacteria bacterium HGW-Actinobacteria-11]TFB15988.1 ThuA domain-containing protein [Microbacterium sp. 3H14]
MADMLNALILSGHMTREHDNEFRSFRKHNEWITALLEDTGRFRVRVIEDPRGLGADIIDKYDVVIVVFEGRDGFFDKAVGFGAETDAALLKFVREDGKGIVWFHGSSVQEDDWGYPEEYNVMRGAKLNLSTGLRPRPWGEALVHTAEPRHEITDGISATWTVTGDDILMGVEMYDGAQVLLSVFDDLESYENAPVWPMKHYPVDIPDEGLSGMIGVNTHQPVAWINEYGAGRSFTITIGHDIDTFRRIEFIRMFPRGVEWAATGEISLTGPDRRGERRFLPWPYYNQEG